MNKDSNISYKSTKMMLDSLGWTVLAICLVNIVLFIIGMHGYYSTNDITYLEGIFELSVRAGILETILVLLSISCCQYIVLLYSKKSCNKSQDL